MHPTLNLRRLASAATLALLVAAPGWSAAPAPFKQTEIGDTGAAGSVDVSADGVWTVQASGSDISQDGPEDSFFFVHQPVTGDGSIIARLVEQPTDVGQPRNGIMIRASDASNAPHAGLIMTTSTLAWYVRTEADANTVRTSGVASREFPRWMRLQRIGNEITGYTSTDGKLWKPSTIARSTIDLGPEAQFGIAATSRSAGDLATSTFDNVRVLPGVVSVGGIEGAATDTVALLAWQVIPSAVGYNVYRGDAEDSLKLINAEPRTDPFYLDQENIGKSLRSQVYAVAGVFKAADGTVFEGPAVRAR